MWKRRLSIFLALAVLAAGLQWEPSPVKSAAPTQIFMPYIRNIVPVVIKGTTCIRQKYSGSIIVRGNVMNISDRTVYDVKIQADFTDDNGQVITATGYTAFTPTVSMQMNPFELWPVGVETNINRCGPTKILSWTRESSAEFLPLTIVSIDTNIPNTVSVLFRNDNPVSLKNVITYAWSLDQYYSFYTPSLQDSIAPGETITYTKGIMDGNLPIYVLGMGPVDP